MHMKVAKSVLLGSVAVSGLAIASPALAQAGEAVADDNVIIVTARRVEENLQDVPISITVFTQEDVAKRNIAVATDLGTYTPSLSVNQRYGPEKSSFALRGFNQDQNTAPTVGVYFADVVGVRAQGGTTSGNTQPAGSFTDLENIQVLKGPQGTLFGRNTTGGAILLVPTRPKDELGGYVEGTIGNFDARRVQAAINVPASDTLRFRVAFDRNKRDGYMKNMVPTGPKDFNDIDYVYARFSMLADIGDSIENYTVAHYSKSDTNAYAAKMTICDRQPIDFTDPTGVKNPLVGAAGGFNFQRAMFAQAACDQIDRQAARGDGKLDVEVRLPNQFLELETWQAINTTTWDVSDNLTVKNIFSYGEIREKTAFNLGSTNFFINPPFPLNAMGDFDPVLGAPVDYINLDVYPGRYNSASRSITEELQLQGEAADGRLTFVLGGYLEFADPKGLNSGRTGIYGNGDAGALDYAFGPLGFSIISQSEVDVKFRNHGIFGQASYKLTDDLTLTGGIRYTMDKIIGYSQSNRLLWYGATPIPVQWSCNDGIRNKNPDGSAINLASTLVGGDGTGDVTKCGTNLVEKSNKPTWLVNVDYKVTPDMMLYAKYARGYRQGGMTFTNPGLETWGPETLDSYELGIKKSFNGAVSGFLNLAAYYNDLKDAQVITNSIPKPDSGISGGNAIVNAGAAEIYGLEMDGSVKFFDSLTLTVGYSYLHTKVKSLTLPELSPDSPFAQLISTVEVGSGLVLSPKNRVTVSANYELPVDESLGQISLGATFTHTDKQVSNYASPVEVGVLPATDLLNLNLDWKGVAGSPIDLAVFATNVTNEIYPTYTSSGFASAGFENLGYAPPRMYGARVRVNF